MEAAGFTSIAVLTWHWAYARVRQSSASLTECCCDLCLIPNQNASSSFVRSTWRPANLVRGAEFSRRSRRKPRARSSRPIRGDLTTVTGGSEPVSRALRPRVWRFLSCARPTKPVVLSHLSAAESRPGGAPVAVVSYGSGNDTGRKINLAGTTRRLYGSRNVTVVA